MAWLLMQHGFISAVEYVPARDHTHQLPDSLKEPGRGSTRRQRRAYKALVAEGFILARARVKEDLEQLRPHFDGLTIVEDNGADYRWRAVVPRKAFAEWLYAEALSIDYHSHFKEVARDRSPKDSNRYSAMMACWSQLNRMGGPRTYSGYAWGGSGSYYPAKKTGKSTSQQPLFGTDALKRGSKRNPDTFDWDDWYDRQAADEVGSNIGGFHSGSSALVESDNGEFVGPSETDTLQGMANEILEVPLNEVALDEHTPNDPFDLWVVVYDIVGEKRAREDVATIQEVVQAIDQIMEENADEENFDSVALDEVRLDLLDRTSSTEEEPFDQPVDEEETVASVEES